MYDLSFRVDCKVGKLPNQFVEITSFADPNEDNRGVGTR